MKRTYEEIIIGILRALDYPMKAKELISKVQVEKPLAKAGTIRQVLMLARYKSLICLIKLDGFTGLYALPQWFNGPFLKDEYKTKIYEGKPIRIQKPTGSLGRTA